MAYSYDAAIFREISAELDRPGDDGERAREMVEYAIARFATEDNLLDKRVKIFSNFECATACAQLDLNWRTVLQINT